MISEIKEMAKESVFASVTWEFIFNILRKTRRILSSYCLFLHRLIALLLKIYWFNTINLH